jgi:hypothetical protein
MIERRRPRSELANRPVVAGGDDAQATIYAAIEVVRSQRRVHESGAYTILVMASIDAGLSLRETARRIVEDAGASCATD